jgi:hypothetical protein
VGSPSTLKFPMVSVPAAAAMAAEQAETLTTPSILSTDPLTVPRGLR